MSVQLKLNQDSLLAWLRKKYSQLDTLEQKIAEYKARGGSERIEELRGEIDGLLNDIAYYAKQAKEDGSYGDAYQSSGAAAPLVQPGQPVAFQQRRRGG